MRGGSAISDRPVKQEGSEADEQVFDFDFKLEDGNQIILSQEYTQIYGRFRHRAKLPISLKPGVSGALNLGVRLSESGTTRQVFEERMVSDRLDIPADEWTVVRFALPRIVIDNREEYVLLVDIVREDIYWFEEKGIKALRIGVRFNDVSMRAPSVIESQQIDKSNQALPLLSAIGPTSTHGADRAIQLVFDVSDLVHYFQSARLPTGIQRVQIELITNIIFSDNIDIDVKICCFTKESDAWLELPGLFFNHICKLALISGNNASSDWLRVLEELRLHILQANTLLFRQGAYLINLGTSWWLQNYFLHVRHAKARFGIRYVPYVHDCIPIVTPEHCVENLTRDFITWALGAFQHADHLLVNSKATSTDVKAVAERLGHKVEEPGVVTLDANFRTATSALPKELLSSRSNDILMQNELAAGHYVLFVSTIESRKNHLLAFSAWLSLVKRHGFENVPKLVCVGNRGWLNDAIYAKVNASKILQQKIVFLSKISDLDLEVLYNNCLFTLYPSSYEGWGLPVTESLCYGKVPILADTSSLPEAGGKFAEYFDSKSESDLLRAVELILFNPQYRMEKEKLIADEFQARRWSEIAAQVIDIARGWKKLDRPIDEGTEIFSERGLWPFPAALGVYHGITENLETQIWRGMFSAEIYRQGSGWWWPEPWGCWAKPGVAQMAFLAALPRGEPAVLYVGLMGVQGLDSRITVNAIGVGRREVMLAADQPQWIVFRISAQEVDLLPTTDRGALIEVRFSADKSADFGARTNGVDVRVTSVGVTGFMICPASDVEARLTFVEDLNMKNFAVRNERF